jgi:tRNA A-37 threonylcarbamoyl transferase component Bud32
VALKMLDNFSLDAPLEAHRRHARSLRNEIAVMQHVTRAVRHPHLLTLHGHYETPAKICLVMDHLAGGELFDRLVERGHYCEADAAGVIAAMGGALAALHAAAIVHRDVKPENMIYAAPPGPRAAAGVEQGLKLMDYGLALWRRDPDRIDARSGGGDKTRGDEARGEGRRDDGRRDDDAFDPHAGLCVGTPGYVAPEAIRGRVYSERGDVFGLGVVLFCLLCGYPPFHGDTTSQVLRRTARGDFLRFSAEIEGGGEAGGPIGWARISKRARGLVQRMLRHERSERATIREVLEHPWVTTRAGTRPPAAGTPAGSAPAAGGRPRARTGSLGRLGGALARLKVFNARRRLRAALRSVQWTVSARRLHERLACASDRAALRAAERRGRRRILAGVVRAVVEHAAAGGRAAAGGDPPPEPTEGSAPAAATNGPSENSEIADETGAAGDVGRGALWSSVAPPHAGPAVPPPAGAERARPRRFSIDEAQFLRFRLGTADDFAFLDADGDGLLSASEIDAGLGAPPRGPSWRRAVRALVRLAEDDGPRGGGTPREKRPRRAPAGPGPRGPGSRVPASPRRAARRAARLATVFHYAAERQRRLGLHGASGWQSANCVGLALAFLPADQARARAAAVCTSWAALASCECGMVSLRANVRGAGRRRHPAQPRGAGPTVKPGL